MLLLSGPIGSDVAHRKDIVCLGLCVKRLDFNYIEWPSHAEHFPAAADTAPADKEGRRG